MAEIRQYSPLDYLQVRRNLEEAGIFYEGRDSEQNYNALAETDPGSVLVAQVEDDVAGSVVSQRFGITLAFAWSMVVAERYRRQGIAAHLAQSMERTLQNKGVEEIWGFVHINNLASQALLRRFGFETNTDNVYFGPWKSLR